MITLDHTHSELRHSVPEDRKWLLCDLDEVENEIHFVFYSPFYRELQVKLCEKMADGDLFTCKYFWHSSSSMYESIVCSNYVVYI